MQSKNERFPSVPQAAALLLAHFLLQYLLGALFYDLRRALELTTSQLSALVMVLATGCVLVPVMHYRHMTHRDLVHPSRSSAMVTVVVLVPPILLLVPLVLLLDHALMVLLHSVFPLSAWEEQAFTGMVAGNLPAVLAACVLAPVLEEMLFRGILLRAFLEQYPRWAAISFSALFFGAAHLNVYQFFLAFLLGLVLGWLFERSRSLIPCIALHAAVNTAVVMLAEAQGTKEESVLAQLGFATWLLAGAAAAVGVVALRRVLSPRSRSSANAA